MSPRALTLVLAITVAVSAASLIDRADAFGAGSGCCVCGAGGLNSTGVTFGPSGAAVTCVDAGNGRDCEDACPGDYVFAANQSCSDPALAEVCGVSTMAPASSPIGLVALIAALSGFGAFYLRRRAAPS